MFGEGLVKGLEITLGRFFGKKATVEYPFKKIPMFPRFHGRFELEADKCIACGICANACPNKVINIEKTKVNNKQYLTRYTMRIEYCLFCGLCVETCPKNALKFSSVLDMCQYRRDWVRLTLVDRPAPEPEAGPPEQAAGEAPVKRGGGRAGGKEADKQ